MERVDGEAVGVDNEFDLLNQMESKLYRCLESLIWRDCWSCSDPLLSYSNANQYWPCAPLCITIHESFGRDNLSTGRGHLENLRGNTVASTVLPSHGSSSADLPPQGLDPIALKFRAPPINGQNSEISC